MVAYFFKVLRSNEGGVCSYVKLRCLFLFQMMYEIEVDSILMNNESLAKIVV